MGAASAVKGVNLCKGQMENGFASAWKLGLHRDTGLESAFFLDGLGQVPHSGVFPHLEQVGAERVERVDLGELQPDQLPLVNGAGWLFRLLLGRLIGASALGALPLGSLSAALSFWDNLSRPLAMGLSGALSGFLSSVFKNLLCRGMKKAG